MPGTRILANLLPLHDLRSILDLFHNAKISKTIAVPKMITPEVPSVEIPNMLCSRSVASNHDDDGDAVEHTTPAEDEEIEWVGLQPEEEQRERDLDAAEASYYSYSGVTERAFQLAEQYECRAPRQRRRAARADAQSKAMAPRRHRHKRVLAIARSDAKMAFANEHCGGDDESTHVMHVHATPDRWATPAVSAAAAASWGRPAAHARGGTASRADVARVTDPTYLVQTGLTVDLLAQMMARELTPEDYEILLQLDNAVAKKTVAASTLDNALEQPSAQPCADDVCMICLDGFDGVALDKIGVLSACRHVFHVQCIKSWLTEQSTKCPTCNTLVE